MTTPRALTVVSSDPAVVSACRQAADLASGAVQSVRVLATRAEAEREAASLEGFVVVDPAALAPGSVHEWTLGLLCRSHALVWILTRGDLQNADGLARFVGAQGALAAPLDAGELAERLRAPFGARPPAPPPAPAAGDEILGARLREALEHGVPATPRERFLRAVGDAETGLYAIGYWEHRLDEEFKRCQRFRSPLGLAAFWMDGEVDDETALEIGGLILLDTRDVDVVARREPTCFVALLPHTGLAGTRLFAERVARELRARGLRDVLGEPLEWTHAWAVAPDAALPTPQDFLQRVLSQQGVRS